MTVFLFFFLPCVWCECKGGRLHVNVTASDLRFTLRTRSDPAWTVAQLPNPCNFSNLVDFWVQRGFCPEYSRLPVSPGPCEMGDVFWSNLCFFLGVLTKSLLGVQSIFSMTVKCDREGWQWTAECRCTFDTSESQVSRGNKACQETDWAKKKKNTASATQTPQDTMLVLKFLPV